MTVILFLRYELEEAEIGLGGSTNDINRHKTLAPDWLNSQFCYFSFDQTGSTDGFVMYQKIIRATNTNPLIRIYINFNKYHHDVDGDQQFIVTCNMK